MAISKAKGVVKLCGKHRIAGAVSQKQTYRDYKDTLFFTPQISEKLWLSVQQCSIFKMRCPSDNGGRKNRDTNWEILLCTKV